MEADDFVRKSEETRLVEAMHFALYALIRLMGEGPEWKAKTCQWTSSSKYAY